MRSSLRKAYEAITPAYEPDLLKTRALIRSLFDQVFGEGAYDKIPVSKEAKESKAKKDIGISKPDVMTAATHERYSKAKKRLAKWVGHAPGSHYGRAIAAAVQEKLREQKKLRKRKGQPESEQSEQSEKAHVRGHILRDT